MLRVGVNYAKVNYDREEIFVHHLTDDVTGKPIPICGAGLYDLTDAGDADSLIETIKQGWKPFDTSESSRVCERCRRIYLAPGEEAEKSKRRLARWKRKEARRKLIEQYEQVVIETWPEHCPNCQSKTIVGEPRGFSSAQAKCQTCNLDWNFLIAAQVSGSFIIWADDETEKYSGRAKGDVNLKEISWEWK
jgi:transcription elongation factor Elf1